MSDKKNPQSFEVDELDDGMLDTVSGGDTVTNTCTINNAAGCGVPTTSPKGS
jgi:hypothetical protein